MLNQPASEIRTTILSPSGSLLRQRSRLPKPTGVEPHCLGRAFAAELRRGTMMVVSCVTKPNAETVNIRNASCRRFNVRGNA